MSEQPLVAVYSREGKPVLHKPATKICPDDIIHHVYVIVINHKQELVLAEMPKRLGGLINTTVNTTVHQGDTPINAAIRGLREQIGFRVPCPMVLFEKKLDENNFSFETFFVVETALIKFDFNEYVIRKLHYYSISGLNERIFREPHLFCKRLRTLWSEINAHLLLLV